MMNVDEYVAEALEGIAEANRVHGTSLALEEIEIVPDDFPTTGQVRHCAGVLASYYATRLKQSAGAIPL